MVRASGVMCVLLLTVSAAVGQDPSIVTREVATTQFGAPLKVVVREDAALFEEPKAGSRSRPAKMFQFFYVLKVDPKASTGLQDGYYRVATGKTSKDFVGWIPQDKVVEWPHRQALGLRPKEGRSLAEFFGSREDLDKMYSGTKLEPLSREPATGAGIQLLPILERFTMKADGDEVDGFQVAYLHSRNAKGTRPTNMVDLKKSTLDVAFIVDTTASMQRFIDATKKVIENISRELASNSREVKVRFALVGYRDVIASPPSDWYVTKVFCDFGDGANLEEFQTRLNTMNAASQGSEDFAEDVLAGLNIGVQKLTWNPDAFKHVILLGDASGHDDPTHAKNSEKLTIPGILALAQPRGEAALKSRIALHTIRVIGDDPSDHKIAEAQFQTLANGDGVNGLHYAFDASKEAEFVSKLTEHLLKSHLGLSDAVAHRAPAPDTPALGLLLDLVRASEVGGDAPHFASGFCSEVDFDGNAQLEPFVLVEYEQLDLFNSALDYMVKVLHQAGSSKEPRGKALLHGMKAVVTGVEIGEPLTPQTSLKTLLSVILDVPVQSPVFEMTPEKFDGMTDADFDTWVKQVDQSRSRMKSHLDNHAIWFSLDRDVPLQKRSAFIGVKDLP
jgi:hypothetical protein